MLSRLLHIAIVSPVNLLDVIQPSEITEKHDYQQRDKKTRIHARGQERAIENIVQQIKSAGINNSVE
jgi:hypothetical protein